MAVEKRIVVGASGASGMPLLIKCLEILQDNEEYRSLLVMSRSAKLTLEQETDWSVSQVEALADEVLEQDNIGAGPASGSYRTEGMVIVPCNQETAGNDESGNQSDESVENENGTSAGNSRRTEPNENR